MIIRIKSPYNAAVKGLNFNAKAKKREEILSLICVMDETKPYSVLIDRPRNPKSKVREFSVEQQMEVRCQ